jgi:tetratricopeptide (TPR) repeat protein
MEAIFRHILGELKGANLWIALGFLAAGIVCWRLIGTTKRREQKVLRRQVGAALILALLAGAVLWMNHHIFQREPDFAKDVTGILVMRFMGDDALNSLQGDLVAKLNVELGKEAADQKIEVHAGAETLDENRGLSASHKRARTVGEGLNARLVIWGRKIGEKKFYPRITVVAGPKDWVAASERTNDAQVITELQLPPELVDEPFYLIHFTAGYSYYNRDSYIEALPHFKAALQRKGGSKDELADLQFFTAFCQHSLAAGQKNMTADLLEVIELYQNAAKVYEGRTDQGNWAATQNNLAAAYFALPTGDRAANVQKAIAALEATLRVYTEKDFPVDWAMTLNNLGAAYADLPTGDRAANLQKAIAAYESALRVRTEKDFPVAWAATQTNLGVAYNALPTEDRAANLQKALAAYEAALRVYTEKDFPEAWAMTQNNLGVAYGALPTGDRAANLQKAMAAYEAALRVRTEKTFRVDWAMTQNNLGMVYVALPTGDRAANLQKAIGAYEAALRVRTERDFPAEWAITQNNLGSAYAELPTGDGAANLQKARTAFEAALRVRTEKDYPTAWAMTQHNLGVVYTAITVGNRAENLKKAKLCFEAALRVYSENGFPENHRRVAARLAETEQQLRSLAPK